MALNRFFLFITSANFCTPDFISLHVFNVFTLVIQPPLQETNALQNNKHLTLRHPAVGKSEIEYMYPTKQLSCIILSLI